MYSIFIVLEHSNITETVTLATVDALVYGKSNIIKLKDNYYINRDNILTFSVERLKNE